MGYGKGLKCKSGRPHAAIVCRMSYVGQYQPVWPLLWPVHHQPVNNAKATLVQQTGTQQPDQIGTIRNTLATSGKWNHLTFYTVKYGRQGALRHGQRSRMWHDS